jgi:hypothetical protein
MVQEEEFRFRQWLSDGARGMRSAVKTTTSLPEAFWEHSWAAGREALLALRSLLDAAIDRTERQPKKVTKIKVKKGE